MATTKPFYKRSEFWTHMSAVLTGLTATGYSVFDSAFVNAHPTFAAALSVMGLLLAAISQAAYAISRGLDKSTPVPVVETPSPEVPGDGIVR